jgi:hypothetical protein
MLRSVTECEKTMVNGVCSCGYIKDEQKRLRTPRSVPTYTHHTAVYDKRKEEAEEEEFKNEIDDEIIW